MFEKSFHAVWIWPKHANKPTRAATCGFFTFDAIATSSMDKSVNKKKHIEM